MDRRGRRSGLRAFTRRDQLRYLLQVAPVLLGHVRDRPLTLIRQPGGIDARRFVHFHYEQPLPAFVETVDIWSEKNRRPEPYLLCNNAATLVWLAHVGLARDPSVAFAVPRGPRRARRGRRRRDVARGAREPRR